MPAPVDYPVFLANVNTEDLAMLTMFIVGQTIQTATPAEADLLFTQAQRLYEAGMLQELHRVYTDGGAVAAQSYTGTVTPVGAGYVARLARERVAISREPLP